MNYASYSTEDFLADESFQGFVAGSNPAAAQFWQGWLVEHPAKAVEFQEAAALLQLLAARQPAVAEALRQVELHELQQAMRPPSARPMLRGGRRRQWVALVGVVLVAVLVGLAVWRHPAPVAWTEYATRNGEHRQLTLPDGSQVTLNANSILKLSASWSAGTAREVWLDGEAYFSVRHTASAQVRAVASAPAAAKFTVHAGPVEVAVLGTEFDVRSSPTKAEVVLNAGQVQLTHYQAGQAEKVLMQPGDLVAYDTRQPQARLVKRPVTPAFYSAWTSGQLDFYNTPVAEIVELLESKYGLKITLGNPKMRQQKMTGTIPNANLEVLLSSLGKALNVNVRRDGSRVWLD